MNRKGLTDEQIIENALEHTRKYNKKNLVHKTISIYLNDFANKVSNNNHSKEISLATVLYVSINKKTNGVSLAHGFRYGRYVISPTVREEQTHKHLMDNLRKRRNMGRIYLRKRFRFGLGLENGVSIDENIQENTPICLISFKSNNGKLKYIDA